MEVWLRRYAGSLQAAYERLPAAAQNALVSGRGWFLRSVRYGTAAATQLDGLVDRAEWDEERLEEWRRARLLALSEWSRREVPAYRDYPALRQAGDLGSLPILERGTVRERGESFVARSYRGRKLVRVSTTGTTGASLSVVYSTAVMRENYNFRLRQWRWAGIAPRSPRCTFFGSRVVAPAVRTSPFWRYNAAERQLLFSIFHLGEGTLPAYVKQLRRHAGDVLEGFPSVLGLVARFLLDNGETVPMRVVFTDGEPLYPQVRAAIERAFATRVMEHYGTTELAGLLQECEAGSLHLASDYAYLEILRPDGSAAALGEEGDLVWTGLINDAMPLLRYRIGDRGAWLPDQRCGCGRALPLVVPTITRLSDQLLTADGRMFSPRALNQVLKQASAFASCQFVQTTPAAVTIRAVAGGSEAPAELAAVCADLEHLLGHDVVVNGELAREPLRARGGKIPLIVRTEWARRGDSPLERAAASLAEPEPSALNPGQQRHASCPES